MSDRHKASTVSISGLLVALGIIYGYIGTSPLYVMQAIIQKEVVDSEIIFGSLSLIFWTLTLQTSLKYVYLILRADNKGEGGIFALYTLVRRHAKWLTIPAIIGGCALLADGMITPPISVASAIEGLQIKYPHLNTLPIIVGIIFLLFLIQTFGTNIVGKSFGPIMLLWFGMLAYFGIAQILKDPSILRAINPYYGYRLLFHHNQGFWLLGAVFLCTTGAEALYSDLGHCGKQNIRVSWVFVKITLLLNYFGQGVWAMSIHGQTLNGRKPFFEIIPSEYLIFGIALATLAAIIASQALISGSYTLIAEAIRLGIWPKVISKYPSNLKGQLYIPSVNWFLCIGCISVVLFFKESANMEAAYGLAITITMLMTTILAAYYLYAHRFKWYLVLGFLLLYLTIELSFLAANLLKFSHGGWVSLLIATLIGTVMVIWYFAHKIKNRLTDFVPLNQYLNKLKELSSDESVPKYSTHLVFMTNAAKASEIESKIMYSIFEKRPKRADIYWFVHVNITDEPYTLKYNAKVLAEDDVIRVSFKLGFRVEQKIDLYLKNVISDMVKSGEVDVRSRYNSLYNQNIAGDFRFVVLEKYLAEENSLPFWENLVMRTYFFLRQFTTSEYKWFGLETSNVKVEKVPLVIRPIRNILLEREM
jgi:KUP system potassium uptake protein